MLCFLWVAAAFADYKTNKKFSGIILVRSGYTGRDITAPTYQNDKTYEEAVQIIYDSKIISYKQLLNISWRNIDTFDSKGQFYGKGFFYIQAIYCKNKSQEKLTKKPCK